MSFVGFTFSLVYIYIIIGICISDSFLTVPAVLIIFFFRISSSKEDFARSSFYSLHLIQECIQSEALGSNFLPAINDAVRDRCVSVRFQI